MTKKQSKSNSKEHILCKLSEIDNLSSKGFNLKIKRKTKEFFLVRKGEQVFAYENICPHAQAPLEWNPDEFLDEKKESIICAMHGAKFTIEEGACIDGPCDGVGLTPVAIEIVDDTILLKN